MCKRSLRNFVILLMVMFSTPARAQDPLAPMAWGHLAGVGYLIYHAATDHSPNKWNEGWGWTTGDIVAETAVQASLILDWSTTLDIKNRRQDGVFETNVLLGKHPTDRDISIYMASCMVTHAAVAAALPKPWRGAWQAIWLGVETSAVGNNFSVGLSLRLP